jgi:hypothetical protein
MAWLEPFRHDPPVSRARGTGSASACDNEQNPPRFKRLTLAPSPPRPAALGRLLLLFAALAVGCGEQEIRAIEPLPLPSPSASSDPPDVPDPPDPPVVRDRGRVQVRDGNLLTDKGTRLRGVTLGIDSGNPSDPLLEPNFFEQLSGEAGLNAFHVYLENPGDETGARVAEADALVEMTASTGMYLVLGIGGGLGGGSFDLEKVRSFWTFYGPRYAERTHVLYELQNIPDTGCDVPYGAEALAMQRTIYELIRELAPSTHVAMFSFIAEPTGASLESDLAALEGTVDWSKASVAFHAEPCAGADNLAELTAVTRARGVAAFASELQFRTSFEKSAQLEAERLGWFSFEWLVLSRDLGAFRDAHAAAGITWCPDFGTWPEDSETCSTP